MHEARKRNGNVLTETSRLEWEDFKSKLMMNIKTNWWNYQLLKCLCENSYMSHEYLVIML